MKLKASISGDSATAEKLVQSDQEKLPEMSVRGGIATDDRTDQPSHRRIGVDVVSSARPSVDKPARPSKVLVEVQGRERDDRALRFFSSAQCCFP
jgi:hypothetical protein